jgi:hypothetical protein
MEIRNRSESRKLVMLAKGQIQRSKSFVLISITEADRCEVISDTRKINKFSADDPLRVEFEKMVNNLTIGSGILNVKHGKYLDKISQANKVEEAKIKRSETLQKEAP